MGNDNVGLGIFESELTGHFKPGSLHVHRQFGLTQVVSSRLLNSSLCYTLRKAQGLRAHEGNQFGLKQVTARVWDWPLFGRPSADFGEAQGGARLALASDLLAMYTARGFSREKGA